MKKSLLPIALASVAVAATSVYGAAKDAKNSDPTVMVVNKKSVPLSEFEYLYNKNSSQQINGQSVDDYLGMFIDFKLKVAEAEASGVDTTRAFIDEFNRYRDELAIPYLKDKDMEAALINEAYEHMKTNRDVNYIMLFGGRSETDKAKALNLADSIQAALTADPSQFADLADKYSVDKNHGHMGWLAANRFPYEFEKAVYDTPVGQVSKVYELPRFGYFIVKVDAERPNAGEVNASHILKMTRNKTPEEQQAAKVAIDSIYNVLVNGGNFPMVARTESEDPGSASKGGDLGWFGQGMMVPEFEQVAWELGNGEISKPFETTYGWHIIKKIDSRSVPTLEEATPIIKKAMGRDNRMTLPVDSKIEQFKKQYGAKIDTKAIAKVSSSFAKAKNVHQAIDLMKTNKKVVATVGKTKIKAADVAPLVIFTDGMTQDEMAQAFTNATETALTNATRELAIASLPLEHSDYRNLINEYRDGMLFFEISNANVWDKGSKDTEGINTYFENNRAKYSNWDRPRYKGYVVFAQNDTVGGAIKEFIVENPTLKGEDMVKAMRDKFKTRIKVERVLAPKGDNQIIDYLVFDGKQPEKTSKQWPVFFTYGGKVIDQPEDVNDVKGLVTADYQQALETEWTKSLREKYPVKVNTEVLKMVKPLPTNK